MKEEYKKKVYYKKGEEYDDTINLAIGWGFASVVIFFLTTVFLIIDKKLFEGELMSLPYLGMGCLVLSIAVGVISILSRREVRYVKVK